MSVLSYPLQADGTSDAESNILDSKAVHALAELAQLLRLGGRARKITGVAMVTMGRFRSHALCTCGWRGGPHLLRAIAVHDAHLHATSAGCQTAHPLKVSSRADEQRKEGKCS